MPDSTTQAATTALTLDDFLHGRPERVLRATASPRVLIVWQHGNEELGPRVGHHIYTQRPDLALHVDYMCGDPQGAVTQSPAAVLGYDINRSFGLGTGLLPYPRQRAQEILAVVERGYDYVLDLHTSIGEMEQFFIVRPELDTVAKAIIAASPTSKVVAMPDFVLQKTLIGCVPQAVAFECNEKFAETPAAVREVVAILETLVGMAAPTPRLREIFYVDGPIPKAQDPGEDAENFRLCRDGYYPVLLGKGKHAYRNDPSKEYACFGASRKRDIIL